jgi:hypothetical protein
VGFEDGPGLAGSRRGDELLEDVGIDADPE